MNNKILIAFISICFLTACNTVTKEEEPNNIEVVETIDETAKTEKALSKFESLYKELIEFKNDAVFKKFGFKGGKYFQWLENIREFKANPDSKLLLQKGVLIGELEQLGMAYVHSKGEETDVTKTFNKIFSEAIAD